MSQRHHNINENQRRAISVVLAATDRVLCEIESWAKGRAARGILYIETNDIPPHRRESLRRRVDEARKILGEARDCLALESTRVWASVNIRSRCCGIRDKLSGLGARHMKAYGELAPELARYMNELSARLVGAVDQLAEEARSD